jgi:50S ribosomal subunit-associated GTPase HflX
VGFISDLPTQLVAAFRATLEEVTAADVILHVRDIANPDSAAQKRQVLNVLEELGVIDGEGGESAIPILELWNKWDLLEDDRRIEIEALATIDPEVLPLSAVTGFGVERLLERLGELLTKGAAATRSPAGERRAEDRLAPLARRGARRGGRAKARRPGAPDRGSPDRQGIRAASRRSRLGAA